MSATLLLDASAMQPLRGAYHGGGVYAKTVLEHILSRPVGILNLAFFYDPGRTIDVSFKEAVRQSGAELFPVENIKELQALLKKLPPGRFFSALADQYAELNFEGWEVMMTIHGLRSIELPADRYMLKYNRGWKGMIKDALRLTFQRAYRDVRLAELRKLLTSSGSKVTLAVPSEHTKHAILHFVPDIVANFDIHVLASPPSDAAQVQPEKLPDDLENGRFFLLLNVHRWQKNAYRALEAFHSFKASANDVSDIRLVCVGTSLPRVPQNWLNDVVLLEPIPDAGLAALLQNAALLLYPTLNEGFGYPPLEAMRFGTPVIASPICSLPEVLGDSALYANPYDQNEIANRFHQLVNSQALRSHYSALGKQQFRRVYERQKRDLDHLCDLLIADTTDQ